MNSPSVGRNDPCPCGSGRKYKLCCHAAAQRAADSDPALLTWRRVRRGVQGFPQQMARFFIETYGPEAIHEAWAEFMVWEEGDYDPDSQHGPLFIPWSYHCWTPDPHGPTCVEDELLHDRAPTNVFMERHGERLDSTLRRYLQACLDAPLSFHEVLRCDVGRGFRARDVLTLQECEVLEQSASRLLSPGDILYAQIIAIDGIHMLEGCPSRAIDSADKLAIVEMRESILKGRALELLPEELAREYDIEFRELFLDLTATDDRAPIMNDTDGEPLALQSLSWEIGSAVRALEALRHLAGGEAFSAAPDGDGCISLPWLRPGNAMHKSWNNTILGHIEISANRLIAHVNSDARAAALREIVESSLGDAARFMGAKQESLDGDDEDDADADDFAATPEARAAVNAMLARHYEQWPLDPLPALGGRRPIDAVKSASGREQVLALVMQFERDAPRLMPDMDPAIFLRLRQQLGLQG